MAAHFPPAPMPPQQTGPFEDAIMSGPLEPLPIGNNYPRNDYQGDNYQQKDYQRNDYQHNNNRRDDYNNRDGYGHRDSSYDHDDLFGSRSNKRSKNNNGYNTNNYNDTNRPIVQTKHKGYIIERAEPIRGGEYSWARAGKRQLPYDEKKLKELLRLRRQKNRKSAVKEFEELNSNQQGIIIQLIEKHRAEERDPDAEWILADVERMFKWTGLTTVETRKIQIIIKRQDRYQVKRKDSKGRRESKSYHPTDILDLSQPAHRKTNAKSYNNNNHKKVRQTRSDDDMNNLGNRNYQDRRDNRNDRLELDIPRHSVPQPTMLPPPHQYNDNFNNFPNDNFNDNFQPQQPMHDQFRPINNHQFPPVPPPMGLEPNNQFQQLGPLPPPLQPRPNARGPSFNNPFQPEVQFGLPNQYNSPEDDDFAFPATSGPPKSRKNSQNRPRRSTSGGLRTKNSRKFNHADDLSYQMQNCRLSDGGGGGNSSDDTYERDSIFSRAGGPDDRDFSEPSSPRSGYSRGSLDRSKSYHNRSRFRSQRYRDADVEPGYSYHDDRRYSPHSRQRSGRPRLIHANTYDDYPMGRGAESRYPPAPPRRITDFEEGYDYENGERRRVRDGRDPRGSQRRATMNYDSFDEGFGGGREFDRDRKRRASVGAGGRVDSYHY